MPLTFALQERKFTAQVSGFDLVPRDFMDEQVLFGKKPARNNRASIVVVVVVISIVQPFAVSLHTSSPNPNIYCMFLSEFKWSRSQSKTCSKHFTSHSPALLSISHPFNGLGFKHISIFSFIYCTFKLRELPKAAHNTM